MKSSIKNTNDNSKLSYPALMITDDESLVVLALSKTKFVVLYDSEDEYEIGDTKYKPTLNTLDVFTGELSISN